MSVARNGIVLVTGASGFIGAALARRLSRRFHVVGLDRPGPPDPPCEAEAVELDLSSDAGIGQALATVRAHHGSRIAAAIHLAGYYSFSNKRDPRYDTVNVQGTRRLLMALQRFDVEQFVFASTMLVHAPVEPGFYIDEGSPLGPTWVYPESKLATEREVHAHRGRIPAVLARIAGVYDERTRLPALAHQIQRIYERRITARLYPGHLSHGQSAVHLEDLLAFFERTIERRDRLPSEFPVLVGESDPMTYDELQHVLGRLIHGEPWPTLQVPKAVAKTGAWLQEALPGEDFIKPWMVDRADDHYALDTRRARDTLGWLPSRRLRDVLPAMVATLSRDPIAWFQANNLKPPHGLESPQDTYSRVVREQHLETLWAHFVTIALGAWLVASPATLGNDEPAMWASDIVSGTLVLLFGALSLSSRNGWAQWGNVFVGIWLQFAPLVFWTTSPAAYLNDTLIGALVIAFAIGVARTPGIGRDAMLGGPDMPPGWSYTPSSWPQRVPIIALALVGFFLARHLAAYQLGHIGAVWDPFFGDGTRIVITSEISHAFPVSDAGLGAAGYMLEALSGASGARNRWRTTPWLVVFFGLLVIPLGATSIVFIIIQPIVIGTWCTLCLLQAAAMILMIPYALDEIVAAVLFLRQSRRTGRPLWRTLLHGGSLPHHAREAVSGFAAPPRAVLYDMFCRGVTFPGTLLACIGIGVALMCTRLLFGTEGAMADSDHLVGALVVTVSTIALAEVARSVRFVNVLFGAWLIVASVLLDGGTAQADIVGVLAGAALIALSQPRGRVVQRYGEWQRFVV